MVADHDALHDLARKLDQRTAHDRSLRKSRPSDLDLDVAARETVGQDLLRTREDRDAVAAGLGERAVRARAQPRSLQPSVFLYVPACMLAHARAQALTHYSSEECLGHNCRFLQSNLTDPSAVMLLKWSIAAREPCRVHLLNVTRLGRPFWNPLQGAPLDFKPWTHQNRLCSATSARTPGARKWAFGLVSI
jgi:hypothetical protein